MSVRKAGETEPPQPEEGGDSAQLSQPVRTSKPAEDGDKKVVHSSAVRS